MSTLAMLVTALALFIMVFDLRSPPSYSTSWHAYLTKDEVTHPLAKYWFNRADQHPAAINAFAAGPLPPQEVLLWESRLRLRDDGYLAAENGWARFEDDSVYVAVKTFFPGTTTEMLDWWFEWAHCEENIRYKIWYPGAHYAMSRAPTPDVPIYENSKVYWGKSRFLVEDVGVGLATLRFDFIEPVDFGFDELPEGSTRLAVRVGLPNGLLKTVDMIH